MRMTDIVRIDEIICSYKYHKLLVSEHQMQESITEVLLVSVRNLKSVGVQKICQQ